MKIHLVRILIAGLLAELLLLLILGFGQRFDGLVSQIIIYFSYIVPMFLGGLWVARKAKSRFILHGILVGIVANVFYFLMILSMFPSDQTFFENVGSLSIIGFYLPAALKILACTAGAYAIGKRRQKLSV